MLKQHLTESGLKYLLVDIANTYGNDKVTTQEQISWVNSNINILEALSTEAESPYEYNNAVIALRAHQRGEEISHMMYIDCSNQALQLYGVLTADYDTAYICNLSSGSTRTDAYGMLAEAMNVELCTNVFNRKNCKKALMTTLYGKRHAEIVILNEMNISQDQLLSKCSITVENDEWLGTAFTNAMNAIAPRAMQTMDIIQSLNDERIDTYYWTMPDNFHVKYDVKRDLTYEGTRVSRGGVPFSFDTTTSIYGGTKLNAGMAPNVIHSIDGYIARELIRSMGTKFITSIHDAFAVHPNDVQLLKDNYAKIMCNILDSNLLNNIITQIANGRTHTLPQRTNNLTKEHILASEYAIA